MTIPDKLPPHNGQAEAAVIGCCLIDSANCMPEAMLKFGTAREGVFYEPQHRIIWQALMALYDSGTSIDEIVLLHHLKEQDQIEKTGGAATLSAISETVHSTANLVQYLDIVWEFFVKRTVIRVCGAALDNCYEPDGQAQDLLDQAQSAIMGVSEMRSQGTISPAKDIIVEVMERIENYHRGGAQMLGMSTGYPYLDKLLSGLQANQMIVLSARPGMGKTSFAMDISRNVAIRQKFPVLVFSLEMKKVQLLTRCLYQEAGADLQDFRTGFASSADTARVLAAAPRLAAAPLHIDEESTSTIYDIRSKARQFHRKHGHCLIVIDYLQLIHGGRQYRERREQVGEASRGIKALAKELDVPVIVLAQMNRDFDKEPTRPPRLSDLKETGDIEQDADIVAFLYAKCVAHKDKADYLDQLGEAAQLVGGSILEVKARRDEHRAEPTAWIDYCKQVNLLIAKQREGPSDKIFRMFFHAGATRFLAWPKDALKQDPHYKQKLERGDMPSFDDCPHSKNS